MHFSIRDYWWLLVKDFALLVFASALSGCGDFEVATPSSTVIPLATAIPPTAAKQPGDASQVRATALPTSTLQPSSSTPTPAKPAPVITPTLQPTDTPTSTRTPQPTFISTPTAKPNHTMLTFTSGDQERGRQAVALRVDQPGKYQIVMENANPINSGAWLIWDYLSLAVGSRLLWQLGNDDTPADYSAQAYAEFCDPQKRTCRSEIDAAGTTPSSEFRKDLNDGDNRIARIGFQLTEADVDKDLILTLSTLYSTHDASKFVMKVSIVIPFRRDDIVNLRYHGRRWERFSDDHL